MKMWNCGNIQYPVSKSNIKFGIGCWMLGICIFAHLSSASSSVALAKEEALAKEDCAAETETISCNLNEFEDEVVVPCETDKFGHPFVRCRVNGVDCALIVDTGCSHTFLEPEFVERSFGKDAVLQKKNTVVYTNVDTYREGGTVSAFHVGSFQMAGKDFGSFDALVKADKIDGCVLDGLLGLDVFRHKPTIVSLGDKKLVFNAKDQRGFKFYTSGIARDSTYGGLCSFFGIVNGMPRPFLLDTGCSDTIVDGDNGWECVPGTDSEQVWYDTNGFFKSKAVCGKPTVVPSCGVDVRLEKPLVLFGVPENRKKNFIGRDTLKNYDLLVMSPLFSVRPHKQELWEDVAPKCLTLVLDTSAAPDMKEWTERVLRRIQCNGIRVAAYVTAGWPIPRNVKVSYMDKDGGAPAWTEPGACPKICLNAKWFRKNRDGEAAGAFFYALVRAMQGYRATPGATETNCPSWLANGIADYARWYLFEPESRGCDFVRKNPEAYRYNGSFRVTASFLDFVERRHPGTVMRANAAMRAHAFDDATFWKDATGKTAEELEKLWHADLAVR